MLFPPALNFALFLIKAVGVTRFVGVTEDC